MISAVGKVASILLCMAQLSGCVTYQAKPLPAAPSYPADPGRLAIAADSMPLPELRAHRFDPRDGLDMTEVAMLAVVNNPDLRVARDEAGIASAQAFAAGLLPDPQLAASVDFPTGNSEGNNFIGYNFGLSYDLGPILARSSAKAAAAADKRKADLTLLWQEWQVVSQARLLFVRNFEQKRLLAVLTENRDLLADRYRHSRSAFEEGNLTVDSVTADFASLQDLEKQLKEAARHLRENSFALNALLGLTPGSELQLVGGSQLPRLVADRTRAQLPQILSRRPDLRALQAGYQSEDQRLRQAIIAQFPALNVGVHRARDNSDVRSVGPAITISLPVFNRNRGNIAVEEATRQRLYDEYQLRMNAAAGEIERLLADRPLLEKELAEVQRAAVAASGLAQASEEAFRQGNITENAYVAARVALLDKRQDAIQLEQSILEQQIAILALVGAVPSSGQGRGKP
ncbi:MAG TPA: TolC family protein [Geomonas sp.]|nr:TolC family protein [Geomonas sp.]